MKYCARFFASRKAAEDFRNEHGGALYKFKAKVKKGEGPNSYTVEATLRGMTRAQMEEMPFCVAWNER